MRAQTVAGWVAVGAGLALVSALLVSAIAPAIEGGSSGASWPMGPGMIGGPGHVGGGQMGPGMMGFGNAGPASTAIPGANEIRVQAANFGFSPSQIHVAKNTALNLTLRNPAETGVVHDLTAPALGIHIVAGAGATTTVGLAGLAEGSYEVYCSVPGHADLGMRATLVVE